MTNLKAYLLCVMIILIISLSACRVSSHLQPADYLTVGIESNPTRLDPRYATDANSVRIGSLMYNSLLRVDENSQLRGDLAEHWSMLDSRTYVFQLRHGVTFHDGKPLTAADVKFTYDSVLEPRNRSPKRGPLKLLESVD
ncbi:MAG: ABC transporter substrate-binding protein, partial [Candidatus Binatia bacterium]